LDSLQNRLACALGVDATPLPFVRHKIHNR
jgi:hypothetical protein